MNTVLRHFGLVIVALLLSFGALHGQEAIDGSLTVSGEVNVSQMLTLPPRDTPPANPSEGSIYVTVGGELRIFFAGSWRFLAKASLPVVAPSDLNVVASGVGSLSVTWTDNSEDETGFVISYSTTGSEPWSLLPALDPDTSSFTHTGLAPGDIIYYRVQATGEKGSSSWSEVAYGQVAYSALYHPTELSSLSVWLDGKDASSVTEVDGQVTQWMDKSGNNRHFNSATATSGPTFGPEGLQFAKGQYLSLMNSAGLSTASGEGLVIVVHTLKDPADFSGEYTHILRHQDINATRMGQLVYHRSSSSLYTSTIARNTNYYDIANHANTVSLLASHFGDFKNRILINGFIVAEDGANFSPNADHYLTQIAGDDDLDVKELIIINQNTPTEDRQKLEGYLAHKWNLAAQLPAGHPYKNNAPTIDVSPPVAPSALSATANGENVIDLTWIDNADDEIQYVVAYSDSGSEPWSHFPELSANSVSLSDSNLIAEQTRYYRVKAVNSNGSSPWSEVVSATTDAAPEVEEPPTDENDKKDKKDKRKEKYKKRMEQLMKQHPKFKRFVDEYRKKARQYDSN